jgi:hypothetical protein
MKEEPTGEPNADFESDFREVTEQLQLPELRLREERRAMVLAAFEQARLIQNLQAPWAFRFRWALGIAAGVAAVIGGVIWYLVSAPPREGLDAPAPTSLAQIDATDHDALSKINVTMAIVNERAAAAERELTWLAALRAGPGNAGQPFSPSRPSNPASRPQ